MYLKLSFIQSMSIQYEFLWIFFWWIYICSLSCLHLWSSSCDSLIFYNLISSVSRLGKPKYETRSEKVRMPLQLVWEQEKVKRKYIWRLLVNKICDLPSLDREKKIKHVELTKLFSWKRAWKGSFFCIRHNYSIHSHTLNLWSLTLNYEYRRKNGSARIYLIAYILSLVIEITL